MCYAFWATWKRFMLQNSRTDNFSFFSASHLYVQSGVFCAYSVHNIRWLGDVSSLPFSVLKTIYCIFFQITLHISCKFSHSCDYQKQSAPLERKFCGENGQKPILMITKFATQRDKIMNKNKMKILIEIENEWLTM